MSVWLEMLGFWRNSTELEHRCLIMKMEEVEIIFMGFMSIYYRH